MLEAVQYASLRRSRQVLASYRSKPLNGGCHLALEQVADQIVESMVFAFRRVESAQSYPSCSNLVPIDSQSDIIRADTRSAAKLASAQFNELLRRLDRNTDELECDTKNWHPHDARIRYKIVSKLQHPSEAL